MKRSFVETSNVLKFKAAMQSLNLRGASECSLIVVDGKPGLGKTTCLEQYAAENMSCFVRAVEQWTPRWMLQSMCEWFNVTPAHSYSDRFTQVLRILSEKQGHAALRGGSYALFIDEADLISGSKQVMETLRSLSDIAGCAIVLIGMGKLRDNLVRYPQIASRINSYVRFEQASLEDVKTFIEKLCEVPVADDLIAFTHRVTEGYNREIKEAIASIERFGQRNGATKAKPVSHASMVGQPLMNSRKTGQVIIVPETFGGAR